MSYFRDFKNVLISPSKVKEKKAYFNTYCGGPIKLSRSVFDILITNDYQLITFGSLSFFKNTSFLQIQEMQNTIINQQLLLH